MTRRLWLRVGIVAVDAHGIVSGVALGDDWVFVEHHVGGGDERERGRDDLVPRAHAERHESGDRGNGHAKT